MNNQEQKCDCKEMSCKIDCQRRPTHKVFFCDKCQPPKSQAERSVAANTEALAENSAELRELKPFVGSATPEAKGWREILDNLPALDKEQDQVVILRSFLKSLLSEVEREAREDERKKAVSIVELVNIKFVNSGLADDVEDIFREVVCTIKTEIINSLNK